MCKAVMLVNNQCWRFFFKFFLIEMFNPASDMNIVMPVASNQAFLKQSKGKLLIKMIIQVNKDLFNWL